MYYLLINEQHQLTENQKEVLYNKLGANTFYFKIPAKGWNKKTIKDISKELRGETVVFVSPVPLLLALLCRDKQTKIWLFHNDQRKKKELPTGKIIYTVPAKGWKLIKV